MTVGILEVKGDGGHRLRSTASDLREVELDPIRQVNADTMISPRRSAADRTGRGLQHPGHHYASCSALDIHLKLDALEEREMDGARHHPINPPVGRPLVSLATIQDSNKSVS